MCIRDSFFVNAFLMWFWACFLVVLAPKMEPKSTPNPKKSTKTACRRQLHVLIDFWWFLSPKLDAPNPKIIEILLCFIAFRRLRPFRVHVRLGVHFCPTLVPFWHQKWSKIHQKGDKNNHRNFDRFSDRFLDDFSSLLGSILVPFGPLWPPKRSVFFQLFPPHPKKHPQSRPMLPKWPQKVTKWPQKATQLPQTADTQEAQNVSKTLKKIP